MNVALRTPWTVETFLEWEERQELRYEFDGVRPIAMTGGTAGHDAIQINLVTELNIRLRGKPCRVRGSNLKIRVMDSIRYPDAYVTCTPTAADSTIAAGPVVVFEVLSKSTERTDRMVKNREYAATGSIQRYIMLEQAAPEGLMFIRSGETWTGQIIGAETVLSMPEIGVELPLIALYEGIDFTPQDEGGGPI